MCAQETQKTEENERGVDLNINIYYGGRGIIDDPTIYVINKMQEVLEELRVHVERYIFMMERPILRHCHRR